MGQQHGQLNEYFKGKKMDFLRSTAFKLLTPIKKIQGKM